MTKVNWKDPQTRLDLKRLAGHAFAQKYHVSISLLQRWRKIFGLSRRYSGWGKIPKQFTYYMTRESIPQLAARFVISEGTARNWGYRCGLKPWARIKTARKADAERIRPLAAQGMTAREIGKRLKLNAQRVYQLRRDFHLPPPRSSSALSRRAAAAILRHAGFTLEQVGAALGVTRERIRQYCTPKPR